MAGNYGQDNPCYVPLTQEAETGLNSVAEPVVQGSQYKAITNQLLYEIWKTLLLILAGGGGAVMTKIISFDIGDGQAGTPIAGTSSLNLATIQAQDIFDSNLIILREGIELRYSSSVTVKDIRRLNTPGVSGGFAFEVTSGLVFNANEHYDIFVVGKNTAAAV